MPNKFTMPARASYSIRAGLPVYVSEAQHRNKRGYLPKTIYFVLHDTGGRDSRQELYDSDRGVSVHYLVGEYPGYIGPIVIKYMTELSHYCNGAGYGKLGGVTVNLNEVSVQFELEQENMNSATIDAYCATVGQSMRIWRNFGSEVVLVGHKHVDTRKSDPRFDWNAVTSSIYSYSKIL